MNRDENSLHVKLADEAVCIGQAGEQPYQNIQRLIEVARSAGADAIHPGYGYLSENADFSRQVTASGIVFIGPSPESIAKLGDKRFAKEYLSLHSSVPLIPGYAGQDQDPAHLEAEASRIGYPVLVKASAGGGGKGMRVVHHQSKFREAFLRCASEAERSFGSGHCLIEKYIECEKHVEIQIIGDGETTVSLLDRECSIQRRHQKIIEESPCPWLSHEMRKSMSEAAIEIANLLKYSSAGTVEYIVDIKRQSFYFLEVNTRIQVEHPITEEVVGIDIVALQLFVAAGGKLASLPQLDTIHQQGHAIEVRLCAENPFNGFLPCTGTVALFQQASDVLGVGIPNVRYETGIVSGSVVSVHFDSMVSKIIVWDINRTLAIQKLIYVLSNTVCLGVTTNQLLLRRILAHPDFQDLAYTTSFIALHEAVLLEPVDTELISRDMLMAAVLWSRQHTRAIRQARAGAFAGIPAGFRSQPADQTTLAKQFISCNLSLLGHESAMEFMVRNASADEYEISHLSTDFKPEDTRLLFNQQGGILTRRFYHAVDHEVRQRVTASMLQTKKDLSQNNGKLHLHVGHEQRRFVVSMISSDEFKREISVYSPDMGLAVSYAVLDQLSWAGRFEERAKEGGLDSSGQRKYLSPMPCHILQILAADGSKVKRGDGLLVMESMKTEISIKAETPGTVRMHVEKGSKISEGVIMCEVTLDADK
ncbi:hypothetical protein H9Q72_013253 [Fusarium xylarioides]|uniref:Uncharacterized protein n=1 Tax=Fusarium xylarioides TaxID=221167 RepID=A0A9P7L2C7_9HYPO|nr:hypothetical protein H9Q72_013253 [Fusarium xylarioides]